MYYWDGATYYWWDDNESTCETRYSLTTNASPSLRVDVTGAAVKLQYASVGDVIVHANLPAGTVITAIDPSLTWCTVNNTATAAAADANAKIQHVTKTLAGPSHNALEFATLFPRITGTGALPAPFGPIQDADGNGTTAGKAYIVAANVVVGGKTGVDLFNQTTWNEVDNSVYFFETPTTKITLRTQGSVPNVTLNWGKKLGSGDDMIGCGGVVWYRAGLGPFTIQHKLNGYMCRFDCEDAVSVGFNLTDTNGATHELAACQVTNKKGAFVVGSTGNGIKIYNCALATYSASTTCTSLGLLDSWNLVFGNVGTPSFHIQTGAFLRKARGMVFATLPGVSDTRLSLGAWDFVKHKGSGIDPPFALGGLGIDPESGLGVKLVVEAHLRVMDVYGVPLENIPVRITSTGSDYAAGMDVFGVDLPTNAEGDVSWNETLTGTPNGLVARKYGSDPSGNTIHNNRTFTIKVNHKDSPTRNPSYPSRILTITIPGQDLNHGAVDLDFGDYYRVPTIPIVLDFTKDPGDNTVELVECAI